LTTSVHEAEKLGLEQIATFLNASQTIRFQQQQYHRLDRGARGLVRRYLEKLTASSDPS
jgi:hypothetical protein